MPSQIFYGGHITDGMDRRCCITYLEVGHVVTSCTLWYQRAICASLWCCREGVISLCVQLHTHQPHSWPMTKFNF